MRAGAAKRGRTGTARAFLPGWADAVLRTALVAYIALIAVVVRVHPVSAGLDASWAFGLNEAAAKGRIFGRDLAFTYGPLGYLALPMDVGGNLARGVAAQVAVWLAFGAVVAWLGFARRVPLARLAVFGLF